jgi:hypothetical protein
MMIILLPNNLLILPLKNNAKFARLLDDIFY